MKTILVMGLLALSTTAFSSVVKSSDNKNSCTLYRMVSEGSKPQQSNESLVTSKEVYGFSLENLEIDFNNREAKAQVIMNIVLGFNKPLVNGKSSIEENNTQFTMLINQVNRDLSLLESVCIDRDNKIIYGKVRETK